MPFLLGMDKETKFIAPLIAEYSLQHSWAGNLTGAHGKLWSPPNSPVHSGTWTERTAYGLLCLQSKTGGLALPGYLVQPWLIRAPKQGAIHSLGSIQLQLESREANSQAHLLLNIAPCLDQLVNLTGDPYSHEVHPTTSLGQGIKLVALSTYSQRITNPLQLQPQNPNDCLVPK